jgi:hypothetical protein
MAGAVMPTICATQIDLGTSGEAEEVYMVLWGLKATKARIENSPLGRQSDAETRTTPTTRCSMHSKPY